MSEVSLLPAPRLAAGVEPRLVELAERRMLSPARELGYELRLVGATVLPQWQVIARTSQGAWLFVDHVEDPTAEQYRGKIPVPAGQHARLMELYGGGVRPDLVWLGHELPATWREGDPIPRLVPPPRHLREKDQRLIQRLGVATRLLLKVVGATLSVPFAVAGAIAEAGLDPIVLGGVRHPDAPVVQWVLLAQWEWE
jgi:hypothetical protein